MLDTYLVPKTTVTAKGDGPAVDISSVQSRVLLLTLAVSATVEQESIDLSIYGGADEQNCKTALASFPQQFYTGEYPLLIDLSGQPEVKLLRAHWETNRWGRGSETPMFEFSLRLREVPPDMLRQR